MGQKLRRTLPRRRVELGVVNAVGVMFYSLDSGRYLYLLRNDPKHPGCWGLPGGKVDGDESLIDAMQRECLEELGFWPDYRRLVPIEMFTSPDQRFHYHTWLCIVNDEFRPRLNREHHGYAWINGDQVPKPLHPGLWQTVNIEEVQSKIQTVQNLADLN